MVKLADRVSSESKKKMNFYCCDSSPVCIWQVLCKMRVWGESDPDSNTSQAVSALYSVRRVQNPKIFSSFHVLLLFTFGKRFWRTFQLSCPLSSNCEEWFSTVFSSAPGISLKMKSSLLWIIDSIPLPWSIWLERRKRIFDSQ